MHVRGYTGIRRTDLTMLSLWIQRSTTFSDQYQHAGKEREACLGSSNSSNPTPLSAPKERMNVLDLEHPKYIKYATSERDLHSKPLHLSSAQLTRLRDAHATCFPHATMVHRPPKERRCSFRHRGVVILHGPNEVRVETTRSFLNKVTGAASFSCRLDSFAVRRRRWISESNVVAYL